jgi:hypothetical protein
MAVAEYYRFLLSGVLAFAFIGGGAFLIVEHYLTWGYLEFELLGHETYGLAMIVGGFCVFGYTWKKWRPSAS